MKSLNQAGGSSAGRWSRWVLSAAFAAAVVGCGGGSDPLGVTDGGGSSGAESANNLSEAELRAAYDRVECGMTIQQVRNAVGAKEYYNNASWTWYDSDLESGTGELSVWAESSRTGPLKGFPDDGQLRAYRVMYDHDEKGIDIGRWLCE